MPRKEILDRIQQYIQPFRITKGEGFQLKNYDPGYTCGLLRKAEASKLLQRGTEWLAQEQDMLYAQDRWSLLLIFQAMDAAGKDSTIKHVMSGVNPQGCQVFSFKQPSQEDLSHDFMWRYSNRLPERGKIGIFNRSYYEEVLVVRVHPENLRRQKLPLGLSTDAVWNRRYREYMEKIKTGSVFEIAEVLRDLQRLKGDKELSFGERKMLDTARTLLIKEIAVATKSPS